MLDPTQQKAADAFKTGMNYAISGKGGTGKTFTTLHASMQTIHNYPLMYTKGDNFYKDRGIDPEHKYIRSGVPGVLYVSYTNPAVTVLRRNIDTSDLVMSYISPITGEHTVRKITPADLAMTVNKLLQFRPADAETAADKGLSTGTFYPYRDKHNKLPPELTTIVMDEVGLLEISLTLQLMDALVLKNVQFIFIGDICQTGASYGPSTLIRALFKLPRIAFDTTYRFSGALLQFANEINDGHVEGVEGSQLLRKSKNSTGDTDVVNINFFTPAEENSTDKALDRIKTALYKLVMGGRMCLYTDLFIVPQKTQELSGNNIMGALFSLLDVVHGRPTFYLNTNAEPIILAVGDSILYDNKVGMVLDIAKNSGYVGDKPQEPMYVTTRDPETWTLLYDKKHMNTVDQIVVGHKGNMATQILDKQINKPADQYDFLGGAMADLDMPDGNLEYTSQEEEEEAGTRQLTNELMVLDLTQIDNGFVNYTAESADATYKAFTGELLEAALFRHNSRQPNEDNVLSNETVSYYFDLVNRLCDKYGINSDDVTLRHMSKTSDLSSQGVKYNWRTVQQTQGSQSYSTFSCFHRKGHVASLMFRENIYTAATRAMSKQYMMMSKALLDGSLSAGGIKGQRYPGVTVEAKLKNYAKKVRMQSADEVAFDLILDKLNQINATRAQYLKEHGRNMLLDEKDKLKDERDVVDSNRIAEGSAGDADPF